MSEVPNQCINNMMEFLERDKVYEHLIKDVILLDTVELQRVEKIIVSVFVVDKRLHKLFRPHKRYCDQTVNVPADKTSMDY